MSNQLTVTSEKFYTPIKAGFVGQLDLEAFNREVNFAIQIFKGNSYLQKCDQQSVLDAVLNVSQTGLTLNPVLKYAYLVPRKGKCCLDPSYQGLIKLATDTDNINSINVQLVYEGDEVDIDLASDKKILKHIPYTVLGTEKGSIKFGYSIATLQDGEKHVEIMSYKDMMDIRGYSESHKSYEAKKKKGEWASSVWVDNEPEMCRKTIVRRHFKYLPKSNNPQLERAIELDNEDYDFPMTFEQGTYIENLLISSSIPEKEERQIYQALHANDMTQKRAGECILYLQDNQKNPTSTSNYTQTDISNELRDKGLTFTKTK